VWFHDSAHLRPSPRLLTTWRIHAAARVKLPTNVAGVPWDRHLGSHPAAFHEILVSGWFTNPCEKICVAVKMGSSSHFLGVKIDQIFETTT